MYVPIIIMVNMDPPHHTVVPSSNFQNPYHLVGMIHLAPNTTRRVSKNSSLVKVYADDHIQGSLIVINVFLCVCFCVLCCLFHLERREAATTARTQAAMLKIGKSRQSNFTFGNLLRAGKVNLGFQQIFIAPKASAEGACILADMGYCYCYYYCYCYCCHLLAIWIMQLRFLTVTLVMV